MYHVVHPAHGHHQALLVTHITDEVTHRFVREVLLHLELL